VLAIAAVATAAATVSTVAAATATAAAVAAATTAAAAAVAATTAAAAVIAGLCFVHHERAALELLPVERRHRCLRLAAVVDFDEAEAARAAGLAIHHDLRGAQFAMGPESVGQVLVGRVVAEIAYIEFHCVVPFRCSDFVTCPAGTT